MDTSTCEARQVRDAEAFWSGVSGVLGSLDWSSMASGARQAWLSVLSNIEGAVVASRAEAVARSARRCGAMLILID